MKTLVFDIETDGLLDVCTKIHSLVLYNLEEDKLYSYTFHSVYADRSGDIIEGLKELLTADRLVGHNIQAFDIPAIKKMYPNWNYTGKIHDTLIMSQLQRVHEMKRHGLGAWGELLKFPKGDFGKQTDWKTWSEPMQKYCEQDVMLNVKVYRELLTDEFPESAIELEHEFAYEIQLMMDNGVDFDTVGAERLAEELTLLEQQQKEQLTANIAPFVKEEVFIPKVNNKKLGYVKGVPCIKRKETPFNCGSRTQVVKLLKDKHNWKPEVFTDKGNPKVSGEILRELDFPECELLADYFDTKKLLGQLKTGDNAWLRKVVGGKIYGKCNHNGAVTGRCTHSSPNLAQVPSISGFKGAECRSLFLARKGYKIVGCDASGLELRNLAHYMFPYDGGDYANEVVDGDVHTKNQNAAGLETRDDAKRFIYAHNYGAGDATLGKILVPKGSEAECKAKGAEVRARFRAGLPALHTLITLVQNTAKSRGYLRGLDGRKLYVHSSHVALNVLLQGAGAVIMKKATILAMKKIRELGLNARLVLHVHDEMQLRVSEDQTEQVGQILADSIRLAGEFFNYNVPMAGEYKIGNSWAETH